MASSNPFRRKDRLPADDAVVTSGTTSSSSPSASLRDEASPDPPATAAADDTAAANSSSSTSSSKPVKKVRVVSPPPLSPDSPIEWPVNNAAFPAIASDYSYAAQSAADPFNGAASPVDDSDRDSTATPPPPFPPSQLQPQQGHHLHHQAFSQVPPPNPFSKTLHDLESARKDEVLQQERQNEGAALKAGNAAARKSLNVDSFHRLLMTGNTDFAAGAASPKVLPSTNETSSDEATTATKPPTYDGADDAEPRPRNAPAHDGTGSSLDDDEDPPSDSSINVQLGTRGKKPAPPPPSSRHGKSLKIELKGDDTEPAGAASLKSPTDVNKPLPPPPARGPGQEAESPFDREAAGKVPELEPLQHPDQQQPGSAKKAGPAPPPRRGHGRGESKTHIASLMMSPVQNAFASKGNDDEPTSNTPSRASSIRHSMIAPAPPPPRRQNPSTRPMSIASPISSFNATPLGSPQPSGSDPEQQHPPHPEPLAAAIREALPSGNIKLAAPPPPPKRGASVRRPASIQSVDAVSRRMTGETRARGDSTGAPPPPPPRQRGSSRSSVEGPPRRTSFETEVKLRQKTMMPQPVHSFDGVAETGTPTGHAVDILADLSALQREVDALRGKIV